MAELNLMSQIVDDDSAYFLKMFDIDCVSPKDINDVINSLDPNEDLTINIASPGGMVDPAQVMFSAISNISKTHPTTCNIVGTAASSATLVAMAASIINISPAGMMMIHKASCDISNANSDDLQGVTQMMDETDQMIANIYQKRTGLPEDQLLQMMSDTTWMNAQSCVKNGFADGIMDMSNAQEQEAVMTNSVGRLISAKSIKKMKALIEKSDKLDQSEDETKTNDKQAIIREALGY